MFLLVGEHDHPYRCPLVELCSSTAEAPYFDEAWKLGAAVKCKWRIRQCPLLAQSGHLLLHCACPLFGIRRLKSGGRQPKMEAAPKAAKLAFGGRGRGWRTEAELALLKGVPGTMYKITRCPKNIAAGKTAANGILDRVSHQSCRAICAGE